MNPIVGRGIGLLGALLLLVSVFTDLTDFGSSLWDQAARIDILVLLGALAGAALLVLSLVNVKPMLLPIAAGIGLFLLGIFAFFLLESKASATGTYLGTLGSVLLVVGSLLSYLIPAPAPGAPAPAVAQAVAAAAPAAAASPSPQPAPAAAPAAQQQQQEPAAALPPAGWYSDPSGTARLRYWDGQTWTENTSA